jgi:uncharacterized membrane protein
MIMVGVVHFVGPEPFVRIMPKALPRRLDLPLVYLSGVFEILGGVGLLVPRAKRAAAWGLVALYVCVFPANIQAALEPERMSAPAWATWARLPFQLVFILWALRYARTPQRAASMHER